MKWEESRSGRRAEEVGGEQMKRKAREVGRVKGVRKESRGVGRRVEDMGGEQRK